MKVLTFLLITFIAFSCTTKTELVIINELVVDTIKVTTTTRDVIIISQAQENQLNTFRPSIRDVAYYMLLHENKLRLTHYRFSCGSFEFWVANGWNYFRLDKPMDIKLNPDEKMYFWNIYTNYRDNRRLFKWEDKIKIISP